MHLLSTLLFGSALVTAAPTSQQLSPRAKFDTSLPRMSNADVFKIYQNCWEGRIPWPENDVPPPVRKGQMRQLSLYDIPETAPRMLIVHNYCDYPIHYVHLNKEPIIGQGVIAAGDKIETPLAGTVLKAGKNPDLGRPVQLEYTVENNLVFYDLSLIDCLKLKGTLRTQDTSPCAGFEHGLQFGNKKFSFQCKAGTWCDDQAYFYHENMCKGDSPVHTSDANLGLTAEFCAANKK